MSSCYCEDPESGRLSVVAPLGPVENDSVHTASSSCSSSSITSSSSSSSSSSFTSSWSWSCLMKFMCLSSDIGGPSRRPVQVIFSLEDQHCSVLGRDLLEVKVCCCPKRDKLSEEKRVLTNNLDNAQQTR